LTSFCVDVNDDVVVDGKKTKLLGIFYDDKILQLILEDNKIQMKFDVQDMIDVNRVLRKIARRKD